MEKVCCICKVQKPITEFHANRKGTLRMCRQCAAKKYTSTTNEVGLSNKIYTQIPNHSGDSYAEHVAFGIVKGRLVYEQARFDLKYSARGHKVWAQVISILRSWQ